MRRSMLIAPLALAACGGGEEAAKNDTAAVAAQLSPGLYEVRSEVTAFDKADQGAAKIDTPVGTAATERVCVGGEDRPTPELFSGPGYQCSYGNYYARKGRMNHTLDCSREGLSGTIAMTVEGTHEAESFEATRSITTYLATDGDVRIDTRLTGQRVGECPAEGAEEGQS